MPARVFRYTFSNSTDKADADRRSVINRHTLQRVDHHCCHGVFTSNDWEPTVTVPPGSTGGLQGESSGVLTGTEGWAKYNIVRDGGDGATRGMLFLSWDNPYFGATTFRFGLVGLRGIPLCDQDGADDTSSFGDDNVPPSDVDVVVNVILRNGSPTDIDDPGDLYRVPLAPVWIFGAGQIWERMEVELSFVGRAGGASMTLPGPGQKSRTLDASPTPQALSGIWVGGQTTVTISHGGYRQYRVDVSDLTPGRQLVFSATCFFGASGVVSMLESTSTIRSMIANGDLQPTHQDVGKASVALAAVTAALRATGEDASGISWTGLSRTPRMSAAHIHDMVRNYHVTDSPVLRKIAAAGAANLSHSDYTLYPGHGVALELYIERENGRPHGYSLHYQRVLEGGVVLTDEFLMPQMPVH